MKKASRFLTLAFFYMGIIVAAQEPPLPAGLEGGASSTGEEPRLPDGLGASPTGGAAEGASTEPGLPEGLGEASPAAPANASSAEPDLPIGLEAAEREKAQSAEGPTAPKLPFDLSGFAEARGGLRVDNDPYEKDCSLGEARFQLEAEKQVSLASFKVRADFLYDPVSDHHRIDLEDGSGFVDLREANVALTPFEFMDIKAGRQILTWGTGDMIFINDLFPKDWNSFLLGRDAEYLKAPSDAVKASAYSDLANLNLVYTPRFDADRYVDGRRISYWNDMLGRRAGRDAVVRAERPDRWFHDDEIAARLYRNVSGYELAAYAYDGFWKSPAGFDPARGKATFPKLSAYGASARGNFLKGIANIEGGYYDSRDDRNGDDPMIQNSQMRILGGYEQEVAQDFTVGAQYYIERMMKYGAYRRALPPGMRRDDEYRHVVTLRLTKLLMNQNLTLSLFTFYSPSDGDAYLRPNINYKIDDHWTVEAGGNLFIGEEDYTFFGQFEKNSNVYAALRFSF